MFLERVFGLERKARVSAASFTTGGSLSNPPDWLERLFGGGRDTSAGIAVDEETSLQFAAVFRAVNLICDTFKALPVSVMERDGNDTTRVASEHPVHALLHRRPNGRFTSSRFRAYMQACKVLWGNGYAEIEQDRRGRPLALWPIHPSRVTPLLLVGGDVTYRISNPDGSQTYIPRTRMVHVQGFSKDGISGTSVIGLARESVGLALAAEQYGAHFFGNGAEPGGYIKRPIEAPEFDEVAQKNFRASWAERQGGSKRHSPAVLEEGMEWVSVGIPNEDIQFLQTREHHVTEIARWFGVPPHKLMDLRRATFSNIEHQQLEWVTDGLIPHLVDWRDELNDKLLTPEEQLRYYVNFDVRGLLRGDHAARAAYYQALWGIGVYTINEIRRLEDMNPIGPAGDAHFVQLNMSTAERIAAGNGDRRTSQRRSEDQEPAATIAELTTLAIGQPNRTERTKLAYMPVLVEVLGRTARKWMKATSQADIRCSTKAFRDDPKSSRIDSSALFAEWAAKFFGDEPADMAAQVLPAATSLAKLCEGYDADTVALVVENLAKKWARSALEAVVVARPKGLLKQELDHLHTSCAASMAEELTERLCSPSAEEQSDVEQEHLGD